MVKISLGTSGLGIPPEMKSFDQIVSEFESLVVRYPDAEKLKFELANLYVYAYAHKKGSLNIVINVESWLSELVDVKRYKESLIRVTDLRHSPKKIPPFTSDDYFIEGNFVKIPKFQRLPTEVRMAATSEEIERSRKFLLKATELYIKALEEEPTNLDGHVGLAWCFLEYGNKFDAKILFRKAVANIILENKSDGWFPSLDTAGFLINFLPKGDYADEISQLKEIVSKKNPLGFGESAEW